MITVALVGVAHIHTPGFIKTLTQRKGSISVRKVWDHDHNRAKLRAGELGASVVGEVDDIWRDPEVKAVVICSETDRHERLVLSAAEAGKHMFVEKPLGMGAHDSAAMAQAVERRGLVFQTGYFMRSWPPALFLK